MYASQRSVNKNSEILNHRKDQAKRNAVIHKGMQKDHTQITPDGKVIQHYKMDSRTIAFRKAMTKAMAEAKAKKDAETETNQSESVEVNVEAKTE